MPSDTSASISQLLQDSFRQYADETAKIADTKMVYNQRLAQAHAAAEKKNSK